MITLLEHGLATFLTTYLASQNVGFIYEVRGRTEKRPLPQDRPVIVVMCSTLQQDPPGSPLWLADCLVFVSSDASVKSVTVENHGRLEIHITEAFDPAQVNAINNAVSAKLVTYSATGHVRLNWTPGTEKTEWHPALAVRLLITK